MKILVINAGSSSLKFKLFRMLDKSVLCSGLIEKIAEEGSFYHFRAIEHETEKKLPITDHSHAMKILFDLLFESALLVDLEELYAVGHRVVHGGDDFSKAQMIDENVIKRLEAIIPLAPLHNPANILGIKAVAEKSARLKQVAVFDTAFHQSMPDYAYTYALPQKLSKEEKIRRYGFHGTSHAYILKETSRLLGKPREKINMISLHLGNGASACAIKEGKSVDTSMGMTPLEGLVMGSRSGDIDPEIILYLQRQKGYSIQELDGLLNNESGLIGLCGDKDMRLILEKAKDNDLCRLALDIYAYRIKKYIGAYIAILGEIDAIVFTGGIGEHALEVRQRVCQDMGHLGIEMDLKRNSLSTGGSFAFHTADSRIKLFVVNTDEELEIALQTQEVVHTLSK